MWAVLKPFLSNGGTAVAPSSSERRLPDPQEPSNALRRKGLVRTKASKSCSARELSKAQEASQSAEDPIERCGLYDKVVFKRSGALEEAKESKRRESVVTCTHREFVSSRNEVSALSTYVGKTPQCRTKALCSSFENGELVSPHCNRRQNNGSSQSDARQTSSKGSPGFTLFKLPGNFSST